MGYANLTDPNYKLKTNTLGQVVSIVNPKGENALFGLSNAQSANPDITGVVASTESGDFVGPRGEIFNTLSARQKSNLSKNNIKTIPCAAGATTNLKNVIGAVGDTVSSIEIVVAATPLAAPVRLKDGNNTAYDILPSDAPVGTSVVALNRKSLSGGWQAILPVNCTANITGDFQ